MSTLSIHQNELTVSDVKELISGSSGSDWLFFDDEQQFSYRKNLLIKIEAGNQGLFGQCKILYGTQQVGSVKVRIHRQRRMFKNEVDVRLTGDLEASLLGVQNAVNEDCLNDSVTDGAPSVLRSAQITAASPRAQTRARSR